MTPWCSLAAVEFAAPLLLLGVSAAAIPIVLHLLARVRAQTMPFPTLRFLRMSMEKTARRRRLQNWLLLLLRALLFAVLAFAVAKPIYRASGALMGSRPQTAAVIVLDNSYSMASQSGEASCYGRAKAFALDILRGERAPRQAGLIFTNGPEAQAEPALTADRDELVRRVQRSRISGGRANLAPLIKASLRLLAGADVPNRELYVLSDLQQNAFAGIEPNAVAVAAAGQRVAVMILDCRGEPPTNVGITDLRIEDQGRVVGMPITIQATLDNQSPTAQRRKVSLVASGERLSHLDRWVTLGAAGSESARQVVTFTTAFDVPGMISGHAILDGSDHLSVDDTRYFVIDVADRLRVLLLKSRREAIASLDATYYLNTALSIAGAVETTEALADAAPWSELGRSDVVIASDVGPLTPEQAAALAQRVAAGGTLIIFPGPSVQAEAYNATPSGAPAQEPLLPARIESIAGLVGGLGQVRYLATVDVNDPIFKGLYEEQSIYQSIVVRRYAALGVDPSGRARVLARLDDGRPFLAAQRYGRGQVYLFCSSASMAWSNFPAHPSFLPVILRLILQTAAASGNTGAYLEGARVEVEVPGAAGEVALDLTDPAGAVHRLTARPTPQGAIAQFADTYAIGTYTYARADANETLGAFVVNPDGSESALEAVDPDKIGALFAGQPTFVARSLADLRDKLNALHEGEPLWDPFFAAVFLLAILECMIANRGRNVAQARGGAGAAAAAA